MSGCSRKSVKDDKFRLGNFPNRAKLRCFTNAFRNAANVFLVHTFVNRCDGARVQDGFGSGQFYF